MLIILITTVHLRKELGEMKMFSKEVSEVRAGGSAVGKQAMAALPPVELEDTSLLFHGQT